MTTETVLVLGSYMETVPVPEPPVVYRRRPCESRIRLSGRLVRFASTVTTPVVMLTSCSNWEASPVAYRFTAGVTVAGGPGATSYTLGTFTVAVKVLVGMLYSKTFTVPAAMKRLPCPSAMIPSGVGMAPAWKKVKLDKLVGISTRQLAPMAQFVPLPASVAQSSPVYGS